MRDLEVEPPPGCGKLSMPSPDGGLSGELNEWCLNTFTSWGNLLHYVNFFFQLNLQAATAALHQIVLSRKVQSVSLAPVVTEWSQMLWAEWRTGSCVDCEVQGPNWESTTMWNKVLELCFWHHLGLLFSCSVMSNSWLPHRLQKARLPCPSLSPRVCSISLSWWCYPTISSSFTRFSSCLNLSQHQGLFQWVSSLHQVVKVLELQLQHQSFQWIFRVDFL